MDEMAVDDREEVARVEVKLQARKAVIACRRAEIRWRRREQTEHELEQDLIEEPENN